MTGRQVQQQTFNAIVREAIEDFGLSSEEAIIDAKEQLKRTGITDFSNLSTSAASLSQDSDENAEQLTSTLAAALDGSDGSAERVDTILLAVMELQEAVETTKPLSGLAGNHGAVELAAETLKFAQGFQAQKLISPTCKLIISLCMRDDANRARFLAYEDYKSVQSLKNILKAALPALRSQNDMLLQIIRAITTVQQRSETVKKQVAAFDSLTGYSIADHVTLLRHFGDVVVNGLDRVEAKDAMRVFSSLCVLFRQLLTADDVSVDVSEAFARARLLSGANVVTESGLRPLGGESLIDILASLAHCALEGGVVKGAMRRACLSDCISTTRACAQTDDICKQIFELNLHVICFAFLREFDQDRDSVHMALRFIRSIAARDECKSALFAQMDMLRGIADAQFTDCPKIAEAYCAILAQLSLKRGDIGHEMAMSGVIDGIVDIMQVHSGDYRVLKSACQTIRNVCSKGEAARRRVRAIDTAESILRSTHSKFPRQCDVAYYALSEMDVLADDELRRDERYTMPAGFYTTRTIK